MQEHLVHEVKQKVQVSFQYSVLFTESVFSATNQLLARVLNSGTTKARIPRLLVVIDKNVNTKTPHLISAIKSYTITHQINLVGSPLIVPGGEHIKNDPQQLNRIYNLVADKKIDRHAYILAIGGGAVLDAVGFAAATAHRGVRLVRMPTTVLSQNDAGIGVKNSVNHTKRKNFLGCFTPPFAVINDFDFLTSLSTRDKRSGIAEAVKVALIKDPQFFHTLYTHRLALSRFEKNHMQNMIVRCAELHLNHIQNSGDPFEMGSSRPLDFGHWSAHKLEAISAYTLRHGEAVAIGIAIDTLYSQRKQFISTSMCNQVLKLLTTLGFDLHNNALKKLDVNAALEEFREHLGGELCITLLAGLGSARDVNTIDCGLMGECISLLQDYALDYKLA
ncbi:MAG: 3-dehydroquinate synthase [Gammaproteobacteria bacterium]|nr:3-dehydroquinate synthase [Gammaproteobacteria bacterium]